MVNVIILTFVFSFTLSLILILVNSFLAKKNIQEREKPSAFECGFDPKRSARLPFSLRFYLVAIIFLIFDVEITLLIPLPIIFEYRNFLIINFISLLFIAILIGGLAHEWAQGALD